MRKIISLVACSALLLLAAFAAYKGKFDAAACALLLAILEDATYNRICLSEKIDRLIAPGAGRRTEMMDKGPWSVADSEDRINSDDFTHDASLILYGDFAPKHRRPYLQFIADELNSCAVLRAQLLAAKEEGEETRNMWRRIMEEKCAPDEIHCSCVPALKMRIAALEGVAEAARLLVGVIGTLERCSMSTDKACDAVEAALLALKGVPDGTDKNAGR